MITYPNKDDLRKYRESPATNQSLLKSFYGGGEKEKEKVSDSLSIGNLLDTLLTNPDKQDDVYICENPPPDAIREAFRRCISVDFDLACSEALLYLREAEYQANYKDATLLGKLKECEEYFHNKDKLVIKQKDYDRILTKVSQVITHPTVGKYFKESNLDIRYQQAWYTSLYDTKLKALSDITIHEDVITLIDVKYSYATLKEFAKAVERFRYDLQMAFYADIIQEITGKRVICKWIVVANEIWEIDVPNEMLLTGRHGYKREFRVDEETRYSTSYGYQEYLSIHEDCIENNIPYSHDAWFKFFKAKNGKVEAKDFWNLIKG